MRRFIFLITLMFTSLLIFAQDEVKEDFYDAEFFFAEEDYEEALYAFNKVYNRGYEDNANINYRIGVCLLNIPGRKTEAIPYLEKATEKLTVKYKEGSFKEVSAPVDALLYLGNAYRINYELDKAIEEYKKYKTYLSVKDVDQMLYTDKQIESCENARNAIKEPIKYSRGNLGQLIETAPNKFNPVVSGDLQTLAFMGKHRFYDGVYVARKVDDKWLKPLNITPSIQSDGNQYVLSLSNDGNTILLSWFDQFVSDIFYTEWNGNRWTRSQPIGRPINSKYYESHACFTPDQKTIYFTSNRTESIGAMDIFKSDLNEDGTWGEPVNLGSTINTPLNEEGPMISPDGNRLYFSSQGHNTIGGYDVFYSELQDDGTWGTPLNLGYPLNTTDDDFTFSPIFELKEGVLTLYAKGDEGQKDLFKFDIIPAGAQPVVVAFDEPEEEIVEEIVEVVEEEAEEEEVEEEVVEEVEEVVEEVEEVETYTIKPVFFDFDSYSLSIIAKEKLDNLSMILNKFPALKVDIIGHTDAVGTYEYNQILSEKRAKSVSDYLMMKGVNKSRLTVKGVSESDHVAINRTKENRDSPEGRKLNRRVQFKMTMAGDAMIDVEKVKVPDHLKIK